LHRRTLDIPVNSDKIITLIGVRRSGKTSYLFEIINKLLARGIPKTAILYIHFEDEWYNEKRGHSSLDKRTPNEAYYQGLEPMKLAA
jgi:hypothetical protein